MHVTSSVGALRVEREMLLSPKPKILVGGQVLATAFICHHA